MFGDWNEYWRTQQDGDRTQNSPEDDPDNGGQRESRKTSEYLR